MPENNQGRGRGRSGRNGQGRGRSGRGNRSQQVKKTKKLVLPDDAVAELGENIYILNSSGQADKYVKTTEAILNYIQKTYKNGDDIKKALKQEEEFDFGAVEPTTTATKIDVSTPTGFKYKLAMEAFFKRQTQYITNKSNAHALIYGQCTLAVKNKLQARKDWDEIENNPFKLLKALREITHNYQDSRYYIGTVATSIRAFFNMRQEKEESLVEYAKRFKNARDIMETRFGKLDMNYCLKGTDDFDSGDDDAKKKLAEEAYNRMIAYEFLMGCSTSKSLELKKELQNDHAKGDNKYPKNLEKAVEMVSNYKGSSNIPQRRREQDQQSTSNDTQRESVGFAQVVAGRDGRSHPRIECHNCHKKGHYANQCPDGTTNTQTNQNNESPNQANSTNEATTTQEGTTHATVASWTCFMAGNKTKEGSTNATLQEKLRDWLLLDNQSTDNIFCNKKYLRNIQKVDATLNLTSNGGRLSTNMQGEYPGFGMVWYNPAGITNIVSQARVEEKGYRVEYDSDKGQYTVSGKKGKIFFTKSPEGLYVMPLNVSNQGVTLVETVEGNKQGFSARQIERADIAKRLYEMIGFPSMNDYKKIVQMNGIRNCPITIDDIKNCEKIYGTNVSTLKGKSVRTKPMVVVKDYIDIPKELKMKVSEIDLCADIMYIQKIMFLVTISKDLKFITIVPINARSKKLLCDAFDQTFRIYNSAGFQIARLHVDPEFKAIQDEMMDDANGIEMVYVAAQQHVPEVERIIRVIKERYRAMYHCLPYKAIPSIMIKAAAKRAVKWLNMFPPKGGVSKYYSPRAIVTGRPLDYNTSCKYSFGSYVQALQENVPTNSPAPRTLDCIFLDSSDSPAGGYELLHLASNRIITRRKVTEVPVTSAVIKRVEQLAEKEGIPSKLSFLFRQNGKFQGDNDALLAGVDDHQNFDEFYLNNDEEEDEEYDNQTEQDDELDTDENSIESNEIDELKEALLEEPQPQWTATEKEEENENNQIIEQENENNLDEMIDELEEMSQQIEEELESIQGEYTRPQRDRKQNQVLNVTDTSRQSYDISNANILTQGVKPNMVYDGSDAIILATIMMSFVQTYSLKAGIKKFGARGEDAAMTEMGQLHERECFKPRDASKLTKEEKRKALESLIFLTEKRDGRIKGRTCANGSKQREWMSKEDTSSPTVSLQSVFITCGIEAKEGREVAIVDIPNAFVQTPHTGEKVLMKVRGQLALILVKICPELYKEYLVYENGVPVLYLELKKALYGMLESSLLFYKKLVNDLKEEGFKINPYDPCVANKMVEGKQLTVTWHVDDLKVSHQSKQVVDDFLQWVCDKYEDITKVKPSRGKKHDYLAMMLDYSTAGVVKIDMSRYIGEIVSEFPYLNEIGKTKAKTPAAGYLFTTNENAKKLEKEKKEVFHTTVAKALFVSCRSRPDIKCAVSFLCTRVKDPDEDDWKKLIRLLRYLNGTKNMSLTIEASDVLNPLWWADASFAVHPDMKSHTGGIMTLGKGAIQSISRKQKLNTKSSTEAELVGADDVLSDVLWTNNFMKAQGYEPIKTVLFQDNTSAMLLEKNGRDSAGKRSRHVDVRYFFIKDCIERGELKVEYCPTDEMLADFMTKPLQGAKFYKFRKELMNL